MTDVLGEVPEPRSGPVPAGLARATYEALGERAVLATGVCFTLSDPRLPGEPLVWVNPAFERTTGYTEAEVLGRNCRFLQGPETDPTAVAQIRAALDERRPATVTLVNYRKDGTAFWNQLSLSPVFDEHGVLVNTVGVQVDVTARVQAEAARATALVEAEEAHGLASAARRDAEGARRASEGARLRLVELANATTALTSTLDVDEALDRLTAVVVPGMADWTIVNLLEPTGHTSVAVRHRDPDLADAIQEYARLQPSRLAADSPVGRVLAGGPPSLLQLERLADLPGFRPGEGYHDAADRLGVRSVIVVPLRARRRTHGALTLVRQPSSPPYDDDDLAGAIELARRAALVIDNARLYAQEHEAALALQRSLLPTLPAVPGLGVHAEYHPGAQSAEVGGDWYDVMPLPDGSIGVAIGDVMGHDLAAAAAMGQYRSVLRAYAWECEGPARVLERVDRLVGGLDIPQLASCCYLRLVPAAGGLAAGATVTYANAGHLPPLLQTPGEPSRWLEDATSPLIGVLPGLQRDETALELAPGATLLLFTDGLVEDRRRSLDVGLAALRAAADAVAGGPLAALGDAVTGPLLAGGLDDDAALLCVRLGAAVAWPGCP